MRIDPVKVPTANPAGFTLTVIWAGVTPLAGDTLSHEAEEVAVQPVMAPVLVLICTTSPGGAGWLLSLLKCKVARSTTIAPLCCGRLVRANTAGAAIPVAVAVTVKFPAWLLAVRTGAVAIPLLPVIAVGTPANVPLGPDVG